MKIECPNCGNEIPDLPSGVTEHQARLALRAVLVWYAESPIREIQMANDMCGIKFPVNEVKAALSIPESPNKIVIVCHAPGDTCLGCDHYHGEAERCKYADVTPDPVGGAPK